MKYAIVDIETTGGNAKTGKITEVAFFIHDGQKVIDEYSTLINPEQPIPPFVASLTGISNKMVAKAPRFFEVAKEIVTRTEDCILVAHNSEFDYSFLKEEFAQLGYSYQKDTLCTVEMAKRLLPGEESYSLGKLCKSLGIPMNARHRAKGDAEATVQLFEMMLQKEYFQAVKEDIYTYDTFNHKVHGHIGKEVIDALPEVTGVYYLYNQENELIYIGKSKNIRKRILQHLSNKQTKRAEKMARFIHHIDYVHTGSELVALLLESDEIKKHLPVYNRAQRKSKVFFGIFVKKDNNGYLNFDIAPLTQDPDQETPITTAFSKKEATRILERMCERHQLCLKLSGLDNSPNSCFGYQIKTCKGACIQQESADQYNKRALKASRYFSYGASNLMLIDQGRDLNEKAVVQIENGVYKGFGFIPKEQGTKDINILKAAIKQYPNNKDVNTIIRGFLRKKALEKTIRY
ncbi:exonuclease domain-containing protein [Algivirga pacifica]|uniref:Exonuclease domain-containing protein n=1 Tax=Algivirga pacifica TaxID=1162670 RepID=A0ABP9DG20_9BACT